jgi:dihydropteroate synthase
LTRNNKIYLQPLTTLKGCFNFEDDIFETLRIYTYKKGTISSETIKVSDFAGYVASLSEFLQEQAQTAFDNLTRKRRSMTLKSGDTMAWDRPLIQGILNVTPDSFSDGGKFNDIQNAVERAQRMIEQGADIIDIGGESTRPGAKAVSLEDELSRVIPVLKAIRAAGITVPISVDSRKSKVMEKAILAGADIINDVSALSHDPDSLKGAAQADVPVILMHASADPRTMQDNPKYENVLFDIYDYLKQRMKICLAAGIRQENIIIDVGIGFGKNLQDNLTLLKNMALFHSLGVPILVGVSRKSFISKISGESDPSKRLAGSLSAAQINLDQAVQIIRVHDIEETKQMVGVWAAIKSHNNL